MSAMAAVTVQRIGETAAFGWKIFKLDSKLFILRNYAYNFVQFCF